MKSFLLPLASPLVSLAMVGSLAANSVEKVPIGSIESLQSHVVADSKADLAWQISYPVHNFNETDSIVKVSFITAAIGPLNTFQFGLRIAGGSYQEFYHGVSEEHRDYSLEQGAVIAETSLGHGDEIEFLARHNGRNADVGWVSSTDPSQSQQIIELQNGDPVPDVPPVPGQRSVADILEPYSSNGFITIGENQKILLFEIFTSDRNHFGFDLQDVIILVSHEQVPLDED